MQQPFQQPAELSSLAQVVSRIASRRSELQEGWVACLRQGQLELVLVVDLAAVAGKAALAESHYSRGMVQEGSPAQVQGTTQAEVGHKAWVGSHLDLEDLHDPIHLDPGGKTAVGIVGDDRKEVRPGVTVLVGLAAEDLEDLEDLVVDAVEELEMELDEIRSVCNNWISKLPLLQYPKKREMYIASKSEGRQRKSPHGFALSENMS
jgi:hypothetical protein